jgi:hypothetical protein
VTWLVLLAGEKDSDQAIVGASALEQTPRIRATEAMRRSMATEQAGQRRETLP